MKEHYLLYITLLYAYFPFRNYSIYILVNQRKKNFCRFFPNGHLPDFYSVKSFMVSGFQGH